MLLRGSDGFDLQVETAVSAWAVWRGLMMRTPRPLLILTTSVHGFWLRSPLIAVGIDRSGLVVEVRLLRRRRIVTIPEAAWILELPVTSRPPAVGERLTFDQEPIRPPT